MISISIFSKKKKKIRKWAHQLAHVICPEKSLILNLSTEEISKSTIQHGGATG